jgi:hypothetical protein
MFRSHATIRLPAGGNRYIPMDLGHPVNATWADAMDISDAGLVVGSSGALNPFVFQATLWRVSATR